MINVSDELDKGSVLAIRSFQLNVGMGSGEKKFDKHFFLERVAGPIWKVLRGSNGIFKAVIVTTNGVKGNPFAEIVDSKGKTPTIYALEQEFQKEIEKNLLIPRVCYKDWGDNIGSVTPNNEMARIAAEELGAGAITYWAPELEMDIVRIITNIDFMKRENLFVSGFLRKGWWNNLPWRTPQSTGATWLLKLLLEAGGFPLACNGTGETVPTKEYGDVLLAGMDHIPPMAWLLEKYPNLFWGMSGTINPSEWNINFPLNSARLKNNRIMIARQSLVLKKWIERYLPQYSIDEAMGMFYSRYRQD